MRSTSRAPPEKEAGLSGDARRPGYFASGSTPVLIIPSVSMPSFAAGDCSACSPGTVSVNGIARFRQALIHVDELVLADNDDVAIVEIVAAHALGLHVDAVRAVEIFDHARVGGRDDLTVMAADKPAVDLQIVVRRAADDDPSNMSGDLMHRAAIGRDQHAADGRR